MKQPYQIILDIWAGNPGLDVDEVIKHGVVGLIVRINSMSGGHHLDSEFTKNWAKAKRFPISSIYFVYNPWVNGLENAKWLIENLPKDYGKRRIFIDIEVEYAFTTPTQYAIEVEIFEKRLAEVGLILEERVTKYSGGGSLKLLNPWPKEDYWWAAYPTVLNGTKTWDAYKKKLETLEIKNFTSSCPGNVKLWQCSGDDVDYLEGFNGRATDVNVIEGTLEEVVTWFGCDEIEEEKEIEMAPLGIFGRKTGWLKLNPNYNFVFGAAQVVGTVEPNPEIKPMQDEAKAAGIPFGLWWDHLPFIYSEKQWGEANWPTLSADFPFNNFKAILTAREYSAVVINMETYKMRNGLPEDKSFIAFSAKTFIDRVALWLKLNRPNVPLILATNHEFISQRAPNIANWIGEYATMSTQTSAVKDSYPISGAKPNYLGAATECAWWAYYKNMDLDGNVDRRLILFRGENGYPQTVDGMKKWLNVEGGELPPPDTNPDPETDVDKLAQLVMAIQKQLTDVQGRIKEIEDVLKQPILK